MKTLKQFLPALLLCILSQSIQAVGPVSTYTFVDPCQRFTTVVAIPETHNCYSFSVTNVEVNDQDSYYTWDFGDGQSGHGMAIYHCYSASLTATQFSVGLSYNSPDCPTEPVYLVYTSTLSPATLSNCSSDPSLTVVPPSVTVCCLNQGPGIPENMYAYNFGDGTGIGPAYTHSYTACGNYIVTTHIYDMNFPNGGCYSYLAAHLPCTGVATALKNYESDAIASVFPNPAKSSLLITSGSVLKEVSVVDLFGKGLMKSIFKEGKETAVLDVESLVPGVYFLRLSHGNGLQSTVKFIKE